MRVEGWGAGTRVTEDKRTKGRGTPVRRAVQNLMMTPLADSRFPPMMVRKDALQLFMHMHMHLKQL